MIELGKVQKLKIVREKTFGVYLGDEGDTEAVLLPAKQVPQGAEVGTELEVFVYKDSEDRWIATTKQPALQLDELALLTVKERTRIGAFLDWGLEKDLFLPYKEQTMPIQSGDQVLVVLYLDKSSRLCATMKVYEHLRADSPYQKGDTVSGVVYRVNPDMGAFIAVDHRYYGMIPKKELYTPLRYGEQVQARVAMVREDGKLNLSLREPAYLQIEADVQTIERALQEFNGVLPFGEKASAEVIAHELKMSKNAFKRALGRMLKNGTIELQENSVRLLEKK